MKKTPEYISDTLQSVTDLSAVIIGRNGLSYLKKSLDFVKQGDLDFSEIIYIDDASSDGSAAWVRRNHPEVRVIALQERKGPSHARNAGMGLARGPLVLLLDCDAYPAPSCARLLAEKIGRSPRALLAVPKMVLEGAEIIQHGGGRCHFLGMTVFQDAWVGTSGISGDDPPFTSCGGSIMMVNKAILPADLRFDETMFFSCEDADFALGAALRGLKVLYEPGAVGYHCNERLGAEFKGLAGYPREKIFYQSRNRRWLILKNFELKTILLTFPLQLLFECAVFLLALGQCEAGGYLKSWLSFFSGLSAMLEARKTTQKNRVIPDTGLLTSDDLSLRPSLCSLKAVIPVYVFFNALCRLWWNAVRFLVSGKFPSLSEPEPRRSRVLFLAPQPFYRLRGMCIAQKKILENIIQAGFAVELLTFPFGNDPGIPGLKIRRLPRIPGTRDIPIGPSLQKILYDAFLVSCLFFELLTKKYTVVHACEESACIAAFFKLFFNFRLVYDMDDILSSRLGESGFITSAVALSLIKKIEAWTIRASDSVLTNSLNTTRYASGFKPEGVIFYDHIPDLPRAYAVKSADVPESPRADIKTVVYAGNLEPYQGIDLLLEALALLFKKVPGRCVIIGGEQAQIDAYRANAVFLGLNEKIEWTGKLDIEEAFERLIRADVLVSPMTQDKAVPSKIYLYMAARRPIVATTIADHDQLLKHRCAVIVPPEPEAFAEGLLKVLENPVLSREMSSSAYFMLQDIIKETDLSLRIKQAYAFPAGPAQQRVYSAPAGGVQ